MFTALIVLGSILAYVTTGRVVAAASWKAWRGGNPKSASARFFFPLTCRTDDMRFGRWSYGKGGAGGIDHSDADQVTQYHWVVTVLWPFKMAWSIALAPWSLYSVVVRGLDKLTGWPARLLSSEPQTKALPTPVTEAVVAEPALVPVEPATPEQRYLIATGRERDLLAQLDAVRFEKVAAEVALGGEAEARKLAALPGKKL